MTGLIIHLAQDRLTGEKETHFNSYSWRFQEIGLKKWPKQLLYLLDKKTINL